MVLVGEAMVMLLGVVSGSIHRRMLSSVSSWWEESASKKNCSGSSVAVASKNLSTFCMVVGLWKPEVLWVEIVLFW